MDNNELEKYRLAWSKEKTFDRNILSDQEVRHYLGKRSKSLINSFRISLLFDIILKVILGISALVLIFLYLHSTGVLLTCLILVSTIFYLLSRQVRIYGKIPGQKEYSADLKSFLKREIEFYRTIYFKTIYLAALSNPLIVVIGALFYYYIRYSGTISLQIIDYLVIGLICVAGFIMGAFVQSRQFDFQVGQLEKCLDEFDTGGLDIRILKEQKKKQRMLFFVFLMILILGLVLMAYIARIWHS
jgi:hypothetical protein